MSARRAHREDYQERETPGTCITESLLKGKDLSTAISSSVEKGCPAMLLPVACCLLASLEKEEKERDKLDLSVGVDKSRK